MTDIVLLPDHRKSLDALMKFSSVYADASDFALHVGLAMRESMANTALYAMGTDNAPEPDPFLALVNVFHPYVMASALHYACARAMQPIPEAMVYIADGWHYVRDCTPAPWQPEGEVTPGVTEPEVLKLSGNMVEIPVTTPLVSITRLPAPSIAIPRAERLPGRPPLSEFERGYVARRRYEDPPFWWRQLITQVDDLFCLPPATLATNRQQVESYGALLELVRRAIESAPQDMVVGELSDWLARMQGELRKGDAYPAIEALREAIGLG